MAITFKTTITIKNRVENRIAYSSARTDDTDAQNIVVDSVQGSTQISPERTKAQIQEHIGVQFDNLDAERAANAAIADAFASEIDVYLAGRI